MSNKIHRDEMSQWMRFTTTTTLATTVFMLLVFLVPMEPLKCTLLIVFYIFLWYFVNWALFKD